MNNLKHAIIEYNPIVLIAKYPELFMLPLLVVAGWDILAQPDRGTPTVFMYGEYVFGYGFIIAGVVLAAAPRGMTAIRLTCVYLLYFYAATTAVYAGLNAGLWRTAALYGCVAILANVFMMLSPNVKVTVNGNGKKKAK